MPPAVIPQLTQITRSIKRLMEERDKEIVRLYEKEDKTTKDIAVLAGMHMTSVNRILHKRGADVYSPGRPTNA